MQVSIHSYAGAPNKGHLLVMKGAPERIFDRCDRILVHDKVIKIDDAWKEKFNDTYLELGGLGERVLGDLK